MLSTDKQTNQRYQKHKCLLIETWPRNHNHHPKSISLKVIYKLEALGKRRPPWLRQIITPIFPNVIMLSLGGERLPLPAPHLGMLRLLWCLFAHLLIFEYPDHHQNLMSSSLFYPGPHHIISSPIHS